MRINSIDLQICVSSLNDYQYQPSHITKELILETNRYKKYVRFYLLGSGDKCIIHMGYVSKKDKPILFNVLNNMNKHVRVDKWSLITKTDHYLILQLHLQSYPTYKYYIYRLSFDGTDNTYIGSTQNLISRINTHQKQLKNKTHINHLLQQTYDKYGTIKTNILFSCETNNKSVKFKTEQDFILQYKPSLNLINSYVSKKRITCTCGQEISYSSLKSHTKTKYHKMKVNNIVAKFVSKMVDTVVDNMDMNVIDNVD